MDLPDIELFYQQVRDRIRAERERQNVNLVTLGKKLGISKAAVNSIEKGRNKPSLYQILLIADLFQIPYSDLIPYGNKEEGKRKKEAAVKEAKKIKLDEIVSDKALDNTDQSYVADFINRVYHNKK